MDRDYILSPPSSSVSPTSPGNTSTAPPNAMPTVPPTKPLPGLPAKRPSPPQPKRPPPAANQHPPPATRPSPPQPTKNLPARRPSPPQPTKNSLATRPSPPQPTKNSLATRPSPPQANKNPPATRSSPRQPNRNPSALKPSPPQPTKTPPTSRPAPSQPPRNPPRPAPPQLPTSTTSLQPSIHSGATNYHSEPLSVSDGSSLVPLVKPSWNLSKQKPGPDKRLPPPRPAGKSPHARKNAEKPPSQASKSGPDPNITKQLSELGPPPDEDPPEIPEEVVNTAAALLDSDSEAEEGNKTSELPGKEEYKSTPSNPTQTEPLEVAKAQEKPATALSEEILASKKPPTPASRPPPPKPVSRMFQKVPEENNSLPVLSDRGSAADKKTTRSFDITDSSLGMNAQPSKKAPTRRPPPPRQSSIQHGSNKSVADAATTASEGKKTMEQDESAAAAKDEPAPVVKRPAGPRPLPRPRSMVVKPTSSDPPSSETDTSPPATAAEAADTNKKEEGASVPSKSPVVKRPPAPRPSSRPRSMLVKLATIRDVTLTTSATLRPQKEPNSLTDSPASKKKVSPQVKRPPAPRKNPISKQAVNTISETSTMEDQVPDISEEQDSNVPELDTSDKMHTKEQPAHNTNATAELEHKTENTKKPSPRPPPLSAGRQRIIKYDNDVANFSSDNPAPSLLVTQAGTGSSQDEPETAPEFKHMQEEEKKLSTVPISPKKELAISKPPPPGAPRPKSRSPTPRGTSSILASSPSTAPTTETSASGALFVPDSLTQEQTIKKGTSSLASPPSMKRPSAKKPPPPVMKKLKSHFPTPASLEGETLPSPSISPSLPVEDIPPESSSRTSRPTPPPQKSPDSASTETQELKLEEPVNQMEMESQPVHRPPSVPSHTRTGSFSGKNSPIAWRASSPKQLLKRSVDESSTESSPISSWVKIFNKASSPKSSPKPSRPTAPPTRSPSLRKKNEPTIADEVDSGFSSPVASFPQPPLPPSTSRPSRPPKPPAPASKLGPPKSPVPSARPVPPKPPAPTASSSNIASPTSTSRPPPSTARPKPTRRFSQRSTKSQYATPISRKPPGKPEPSVHPSLTPQTTPGHPLYKYVCSEPHGIANTHHDANNEEELSYQEGDVIELIEKVDDYWYYAANANTGLCEGLVVASDLNIVKRIPGKMTVEGFEDGPCAVATHKFERQSFDELSFESGELIMLKSRYGEDWFRGKLLNGKEGIFPINFVEVVEELPESAYEEPELAKKKAEADLAAVPLGAHTSTALYDFDGQDGELTFKASDRIQIVAKVNEEWVLGKMGASQGMFPVSFVDSVPPSLPPMAEKEQDKKEEKKESTVLCKALYEFTGESGEELSFEAGESIMASEKVNDEWLKGHIGTREGMFPVAFVEIISEIPTLTPPPSCSPQKATQQAKSGTSPEKVTQHLMDDLMPKGIALSDFQSSDISFMSGDVLLLLTKEPGNKFMGENTRTGDLGIFPASYVDVKVPLP